MDYASTSDAVQEMMCPPTISQQKKMQALYPDLNGGSCSVPSLAGSKTAACASMYYVGLVTILGTTTYETSSSRK